MKLEARKWVGIGLLLLIGMIHLYLAPSEAEEMAILGYLFVANFVAAVAAAVGIRRGMAWGWVLGFWVAGGAIAGYVVTRTVRLPGMDVEPWLYPAGVLSTLLEVGFLALFFVARPWETAGPAPLLEPWLVLPAAVAFVAAFGAAALLWGALGAHGDARHEPLARATPISNEELAEKYGIQVVQIAPSMMNSIVDVRLRILDRSKAQALLSDHRLVPVLIVDDGKAVLTAPNQHMHAGRLKEGAAYYAFYPNPEQVVRAGAPVAVQIGDRRLPAIAAQ